MRRGGKGTAMEQETSRMEIAAVQIRIDPTNEEVGDDQREADQGQPE